MRYHFWFRMVVAFTWIGLLGCEETRRSTDWQVVAVESTSEAKGVDWPQFLGPTQDSVSPESGISTNWPREGLPILWEAEMGIGYAPPVIAQGKLYHFDRFAEFARLTARDATTGKLVWKYEYPTNYEDQYGYDSGPRCSPLVDGDYVYLHGVEGMLTCVQATTGKAVWQVDTQKMYTFQQNFFGVGSCPIVEGDLLIVAIGGSDPKDRPENFTKLVGNGSAIVAFDKKTGKEMWRCSKELASYSSPVVRTIAGLRRGFYFARGGLICFDPKTGQETAHFPWRARTLESVNASNPVFIDNKIFLTECYEKGGVLLEFQQDQFKVVWSDLDKDRYDKALACHWNTPIHVNGYLYGSSGRHEAQAELRCIRLHDGEIQWSERGLSRCSLTQVDGHFLCLGERGQLSLLRIDPKKFSEVARWKIPDVRYPTWAAPVVSHGKLYLRGEGRLICCEFHKKS